MPMGKYKDFNACVIGVSKEHPDWSKDRVKKYCGEIYQKTHKNSNLKNLSVKFNAPIGITESVDEKFDGAVVGGLAIEPTTSKNKILYTREELEPAVISMVGKKLLKDHVRTVDATAGKVVKAWYEDGVKYRAEIPNIDANKDIIDKIRTGIIDQVSIGASVKELLEVEIEEGDEKWIAYKPVGLEFDELSLTPTPGVSTASISLLHALTEAVNSAEVDDSNNKMKGEKQMEKDANKELEELRAFKDKVLAEKEKSEFKNEVVSELDKRFKKLVEDLKDDEPEEDEVDENDDEDKDEEPETEESNFRGQTADVEDKSFTYHRIKSNAAPDASISENDYLIERQKGNRVAFWKMGV